MIWIIYIGLGSYLLVMYWLMIGMRRLKKAPEASMKMQTSFTVVIPFRDEARNLPALLDSIEKLEYPKELFEILLVDDESTDGSIRLLNEYLERASDSNYKFLASRRHSASPKKDAINMAISHANHEWILTTDADCELPANWLRLYDVYIQENKPKMICGPVYYRNSGSLLDSYQYHDGMSLQLVAMGGFGWNYPLICNGANLGYQKAAFEEVGGFSGNTDIASGDDIFLMEKIKRSFPNGVRYLKHPEAMVATIPETSWTDMIQQRIRWASKTTRQKSPGNKILGGYIILFQFFLVAGLPFSVLYVEFGKFYLVLFLGKIVIDLWAVNYVTQYFEMRLNAVRFLLDGLLYPFITLWVFINSLGGKYRWKGRSFNK